MQKEGIFVIIGETPESERVNKTTGVLRDSFKNLHEDEAQLGDLC